jgi:LAGLIDADG endonuclease
MKKHNNFLNNRFLTDPDYLAPFFVGLFEGGGGIYFRKAGNKHCPYFLIKLQLHPENKIMLQSINDCLQLKASIYNIKATSKTPSRIVMRGGSKLTIDKCFCIFEKHGLLTSKKSTLFKQLKQQLVNIKVLNGPVTLDKTAQNQHITKLNQIFVKPNYFGPWLSGFLESKASFSVYPSNDYRIYLSIINDFYLIHTIKNHFQSHHKIVVEHTTNQQQTVLYRLSITCRPMIEHVIDHLKKFPFLGYQQVIYNTFCHNFRLVHKRNQIPVPVLLNQSKVDSKTIPIDYIEAFFVGLFEGDGTITFGRTKGKKLSYGRFQIGLKYTAENHTMLECIRTQIGGTIHYAKKKKGNDQVIWVALSQKDVKNILSIFKKYPLLTSRKICQLDYLKQCNIDRSWSYHLQTRDSKYVDQQKLIQHYKKNFVIPHYFGPWLSGFIEAEGCFRSTHYLSLYVGQNDDWYVLNAIKRYFNSHHKLNLHKDLRKNAYKYHYRLSMSGKPTIEALIKHFDKYPLLGYKKVSYDYFCNKFKQNKK